MKCLPRYKVTPLSQESGSIKRIHYHWQNNNARQSHISAEMFDKESTNTKMFCNSRKTNSKQLINEVHIISSVESIVYSISSGSFGKKCRSSSIEVASIKFVQLLFVEHHHNIRTGCSKRRKIYPGMPITHG